MAVFKSNLNGKSVRSIIAATFTQDPWYDERRTTFIKFAGALQMHSEEMVKTKTMLANLTPTFEHVQSCCDSLSSSLQSIITFQAALQTGGASDLVILHISKLKLWWNAVKQLGGQAKLFALNLAQKFFSHASMAFSLFTRCEQACGAVCKFACGCRFRGQSWEAYQACWDSCEHT